MNFSHYLIGMTLLAIIVASFIWSAWRIRTALFPLWTGAQARLVEFIWAAAGLTVLCQVLAVAGVFAIGPLVVGSLVWLGIVRLALDRLADRVPVWADEGDAPSERVGMSMWILVTLGVIFIVAHWWTGIQSSLAEGMFSADTLWYHGPFSARIAADGSVWPLHFTDTQYLNWFYPQNSELQHALGMVALERDVLSPLINLIWLGLALLGAWCIGSRFGVGPLTLLATAIVLDTGNMIPREAGTMANDVAPVALLLAGGGLLVSGTHGRAPDLARKRFSPVLLTTVGLSAGLALGTKLTALAAFATLFFALVLIAPREARWPTLGALVLGAALTGGLWPLRDLVHSGNPLPWFQSIGPIDLPGPGRGLEGRDPYSLSHYIFVNPDGRVWGTWILDGVRNVLGPFWPLILGGAAAGSVLAALRPRIPAVRALGLAALVGGVAYVFTPLTAAGPDGSPFSFTANFRYLVPVLCLGLALLALEPKVTPARARLALAAGALGALVVTGLFSDSAVSWTDTGASTWGAVLVASAIVGAAGLILWSARYSRRRAVVASVAVGVAGVVAFWFPVNGYVESRYLRDSFSFQPDGVAKWAKPLSGERIAVVGSSGGFTQYTLYGDRLGNRVQYLGRNAPAGDFRPIEGCAAMMETINQGRFDYLVTTPVLDLNRPTELTASPERVWALRQPELEEIRQSGLTSVFAVGGRLDPGLCRAREGAGGR